MGKTYLTIMKRLLSAILVLLSSSLFAQTADWHLGGTYGIPRYDSFFDLGFESRLGGMVRWRAASTDRLRVGASLAYQRFRPLQDNPTDVFDARMIAVHVGGGYRMLPTLQNRLEVTLETGYAFLVYNEGNNTGGGLELTPGLQYLLAVEEAYGVELGIALRNVFDRFGADLNPSQSGLMQFVELRLGITLPADK